MLWTLLAIVILIIAVPLLLYIPPIQEAAKNYVIRQINEDGEMEVEIDYIRLKFPLNLQVNGVTIKTTPVDTMLTAGSIGVSVKLMPLFHGEVDINGAEAESVFYQMGNADSLMWLRAKVDRAKIEASSLAIKKYRIDVDRAMVDGADISLRMLADTTEAEVDTTSSAPWIINARDLELRRINYRMTMLPTIDSLGVYVENARLTEGKVDIAARDIKAKSLSVDSVTATYLYPSASWLKEHPYPVAVTEDTETPSDELWTISAGHLGLTGKLATYAERDARPLAGLDPSYLQARNIVIEVDSFYNKGTDITVPIKRLSAVERCGLPLNVSGVFSMKDDIMHVSSMEISTMLSRLSIDATLGLGDMTTDPDIPVCINSRGNIALADIRTAYPSLKSFIAKLPAGDLEFNTDIDGTSSALNVYALSARLPRMIFVNMVGRVENYMNPTQIAGNLSINGWLRNMNSIKPTILETRLAKMVNIPDIELDGMIDYRPNHAAGNLKATTSGGKVVMMAEWNGLTEGYDLDASFDSFPVEDILPTMGIGNVTASVRAKGEGYNPLKAGARADIKVEVDNIVYNRASYRDIYLDATVSNGEASGCLISHNAGADVDIDFVAGISRESYDVSLDGDITELNLRLLGLTDSICNGSLSMRVAGVYNPVTSAFDVSMDVDDLSWHLPGIDIETPSVTVTALSNDSTLRATLINGDLSATLTGGCGVDSFMTKIDRAMTIAMKQVDERQIDVSAINAALPNMSLCIVAGKQNLVSDYLKKNTDIQFNSLNIGLTSDSLFKADGKVIGMKSGSTEVDTISINAFQRGAYLVYTAYMNNRPGTFDDFAYVGLNGYITHDRLSAVLRQNNIKGEKGFQLGLRANMNDSVATVKIVPYTPTIAYQEWSVNTDNYVSYDFVDRHLDANLKLTNEKSLVKLYTEHVEGDTTHTQEDIILEMSDIKLQDWLSISPFAPPIKGNLGANMRFRWDSHDITGRGNIGLTDFYYGRERVGDFDLGLDLTRNNSGALRADLSLLVDSVKTITAQGVLNDSTLSNPFLLDFKMIRFPLKVVNPFLPADVARLSGTLNGTMDVTGDMANPIFNGYLDFDSAVVNVPMLGTALKFAETKIPVDSNVVYFNDFTITACNENPLRVNGTVDARHISEIAIDLGMNARNMMIVNSDRARGRASVYGKAYVNLDATARGNMRLLRVDASLAVPENTNVTYIIPDATTVLASQSTEDMVKFVQFSDTAAVAEADSLNTGAMALLLNAELDIRQGSTISVDLSADGKNKAQIQSVGKLTYSLNPMNDGRLTGRLDINNGFVRYTPPLMSEKLFNFKEDSYVSFNGDIMNPTLNIKAVDRVRANVTQEGQNSRLVNFDVSLGVTGGLNNMNVVFDLSTADDITVQNELSSMSAEQRANQAMNLLLYNVYVGAGTKANANLYGNPLYSFLESQINTWMANNVRGVDISFGIDQYDKTVNGTTSTTTSYSYRVSKTLFNDRFKIIVGGNYSTDADADENFSQNLINDISFEYMLNSSGSMYVKIFRHVGYESILEGEVTQTGVGFVLKRNLTSLRELFGRKSTTPKTENR
ncbi:MAG: translocation/assembly module TamB domain-containing protein [Muribaculaceae bacterium]|nr:translocation/assembly module TamB domain-containing protein [Muribaculaceae bacterium]